ncbi:sigma-70 family RNA polymerase sigma factor [Patescibacteria group bacterium]|nr:sigma-70 family RNA polymerase sigma factor [Patescibacteria group bacterium]
MTEKEIQTLISRIQAGETELFGRIFEQFSDKLFRHVAFRVKDRETAKDIVSEVFLGAWQSLPRYRHQEKAKFSTWLFSIARRILADYYRKHQRTDRGKVALEDIAEILPDERALPEETASIQLASERVISAIQLLPLNMAEAVTLHYIDEMEYVEMAAITGKTEGNLRVLVHRGLQQLKKILNHD